MKTVINGREFKVKQTGRRFLYWSPRAVRWLPVKRANVIFANDETSRFHADCHAVALAEARVVRTDGGAHARLLEMARVYRFYFAHARSLHV